MIPTRTSAAAVCETTTTFAIENGRVTGLCDGLGAMRQAVRAILDTERYRYLIFSWEYGLETGDLYGTAAMGLEARVTEALLQDARVTGVTDFCEERDGARVHLTFTVQTVYGDLTEEVTQ